MFIIMIVYFILKCAYGFESHPRQLIFLRKSDCLGCAVLPCLVVCLTLLASFFLPSHLSLKHVYTRFGVWCLVFGVFGGFITPAFSFMLS